ncbi:PPC domain-containing protein, partial [Myxococcota bacterium]|nr:PPC domain-containing protein [Myxococcota bacterium]
MRTTTRFITLLAFAITLAACGEANVATDDAIDPVRDDSRDYPQGLTVLDFKADSSLRVAFAKDDRVIIMEALRGRSTPAEYKSDPSVPRFEVDARITDKQGRLLYLRRGGDDFVDPTWADDLLWQDNMLPPQEGNFQLFEMIAEASNLIERELANQGGADSVASVLPEIKALKNFGVKAPEAFIASESAIADRLEGMSPEELIREAGGGGTDGPEDAQKYLGSGWYFIAVHRKSISFTFGTGDHSATRIHKYAGPGSFTYFDFCNHGTCAGDMGEKCRLTMINKPAWTAMTCSTEYNTWSNSGGHNCHDDTRVQMAAFVYGPVMARNQYWCNDGDSSVDLSGGFEQGGSPDCNDGTDTGYNHPSMLNYWATNTNSAQQNTTNYTVVLSANATYTISTCGASGDTYLRLKNSSGTQVAYNDDGCGLQSAMTYTPSVTGTYTINAGCFSSNTCYGKIHVKLVSSSSTPPATWYSATNTNSALQNTSNFYQYFYAGYTY